MRAGRSVQEASASAASTVRLHYKGHVNSPEDIYQPRSCCSFAIVGSEQQTFTQSPVVGHSQLGVTDQRLNVIFSQQHCHLDLEVFLVFLLPFRACQDLWQVVEDKLCQPEVLFPLSPTTVHQVLNLHCQKLQGFAQCSTSVPLLARTSVCLIASMSNLSIDARLVAIQVDCNYEDKFKQCFTAMW